MGAAWLAMGVAPVLGGAWLVAKHGFRVEGGPPRALAAAILAWAWVTIGMEILGNVGRLDPPALVAWSMAALALGAVATRLGPKIGPSEQADAAPREPLGWAAVLASALVAWAALRVGLVSFFHPVKVVSDGPIYHLYFAARWWKAGRLGLVATPFGEVGATYFWANGELVYAWLMTLYGGDRFAKLGQAPFIFLGALAVGAIARRLQVRPPSARIAAAWFLTIGPTIVLGFEPNVDSILVAGYLGAVYFFLRALTTPGGVSRGDLVLGSLAAGLGMGTKPTGIVFFPPLLLIVVILACLRERPSIRRCLAGIVAILIPAAAMMGYWPVRNAWLTGNPLYPIQVEAFGRVWLGGWFRPEAMRESLYYVPRENWRAFVDIMLQVLDPRRVPLWLAAALGCWAWGQSRAEHEARRGSDRWIWGIMALAAFNLAAYWIIIPYRTQQRFSFPALALVTVALARLLDRAAWLRWAAVALLALHIATPQTWPIAATEREIPWDMLLAIPNAIPSPLDLPSNLAGLLAPANRPRVLAAAYLGLAAFGAAGCFALATRRKGRAAWAAGVAWLAVFVTLGSYELGGYISVPFPFFRDFYNGWMALESRAGPGGARVAYAGNKIPYYLMGSKLQNDVRYVNIDVHRDWLMHDYHRNAANVGEPTTWPNPFPGWDRLRPDYAAWLANLRAAGIDLLVVTRVNIEEGRQNAADRERFPIERVWADAHAEAFRPLYGVAERDPQIKVYQVLPPPS